MNEDIDVLESSRSREIVQEILDFGVNQLQIKKIIQCLSLELEDRRLMQEIVKLITDDFEGTSDDKPKIQL